MDIKSNLFATPIQPSARPQRQASEARLAFEAMLSAGAARQTVSARPEPAQPVQISAHTNLSTPPSTEDAPFPLARPGRVLDIRV
jgi:hypothetical protein